MKLLYLTPGCFDKGGISRYCRYQISTLREIFGSESVRVLSLLGPTDNSFEEKFDVWWSGTGISVDQKVRFTINAVKEILVWRPEVVHSAHVNLSGLAYILALLVGAKTVLNTYGLEVWSGLRWDASYGLGKMEYIISDCHFTAEYLKDNSSRLPETIGVIWDCVDIGRFSPGPPEKMVLEKYGIPDPDQFFNILTLGRLSVGASHKGYERLLHTFTRVSSQVPKARLIIAGSGDSSSSLKKKTERLQIDKKVVFTGAVHEKDLVDIYRAAHVFSLVSDRGKDRGEGIPLAPLEAMASGVPILVGNQDGSQEAIVAGRNGFVLDPFDLEANIDVIMTLVNNERLRKQLSVSAVEVAREYFSYDVFKTKHLEFYTKLFDKKGLKH